MKISNQTMAILKNFQRLNKSLLFTVGKELRTISESGTMFAIAQIDEEIPVRAGIYELNKLVSVLSLYDDPNLTFGESYFEIKDGSGKKKTRLTYTEPSLIMAPPENKTPKIKDGEVRLQFELSQEDFNGILKASSSLDLNDFVVKTEDGVLYVGVANVAEPNSNTFYIEMGDVADDMFFVIDITALKFIDSNYTITIGKNKVIFDSGYVQYYVAVDSTKSKL